MLANAGIASYGSVLNVDPATFRRVIDVNVNGVFHTVRAALPSVIERQGYILVVSSLAAFAAAPGVTAYNASKAGVEHFANALHLEVDHHGVDGRQRAHVVDRHPAGAGRQARTSSPSDEMLDSPAAAAEPDHDVESCVDGVRDGAREAQPTGLRAGLGGRRRDRLRTLRELPAR